MVGKLPLGDQIRETHIRFRMMDGFEYYINAVDEEYEAEDAIFNGYIYKIETPQFNLVNRSHYGNCCDFKQEFIAYRSKNCFIPTKGYCFVKCFSFITGEDYKQQYLDFIRNEQRRSNIITKARIRPFCRANNINIEYFDGIRVFPRTVIGENKALYLYNNYFCLT